MTPARRSEGAQVPSGPEKTDNNRGRGRKGELSFDTMTKHLLRAASEGPLALLIHARPDGDCVGSAYALSELLRCVGCETAVVCSDRMPSRLSFLAPDGRGFEAGVPEGRFGEGARAIALDVGASSQLGSLEGKYDVVLTIDHHSGSAPFSPVYLDASASATGEIVWRIARNWYRTGVISGIPDGVAYACYAAISSDTGCFRYSNVTAATHRIAAQLVGMVPDHAGIDRRLFEIKTPGRIAAEKAAIELLRSYHGGDIAVCPISREQILESGLPYEELDALIDVARSVDGVKLAFSVRGERDGTYRVSARSNSDIDVSQICAGFGGGGHVKAAGCTVRAASIEEATHMVVAAAEKKLPGGL
ncbi:MAG: DHH family phosphoesterase [Clostridia bacterium]|nr:DHH family phosphoesterase [Clostridia bacterium]